ncbi:MAG TPA: VWA domain-containing protein [Thermoanaerobaculia bacterium]|nr:VWA domain-containing protein [Thermoanaerobaculia bacterium]
MPRLLVLLALLLPTFGRAAETATVAWHRAPAAAAAVARAQQKMLLVYYVGDCGRCSAASDAMFENAASDEVFKTALDSFLPLRIDAATAAHPIVDALRKQKKAPLVAIYDTEGVQLQALSGDDVRWNKVGELLLRFRAARRLVAAAAEFRLRGNSGAVAYALGEGLMAAREPKRAAEQYDLAVKAYGSEYPQDRQFSEIMGGYARFAAGQQKLGRHEVTKVLRAALSDAVAAEAHFRLGAMSEASQKKSVPVPSSTQIASPRGTNQRTQDPVRYTTVLVDDPLALKAAIASYRKAYELAAPGSGTLEGAIRALARVDDRPLPPKEGIQSTLRLTAPPRPTLTGEAEFVAEAGPGVARVDFFLDDRQVASKNKAPFRATIDVGPTARARSVKARAFDAKGQPLGDAVVAINDRLDSFVLTIVSPVSDVLRADADVELDVRVPPGRTLKNVELSWNGAPFASLTQPPFRARMKGSSELGYLRAFGTLDDGTTAEATKLFNTVESASVEVAAVTLIASVADSQGDPIPGLASGDFAVLDEGKPVAAELRSSEDDPITIGIAVDSSSSMAGKQLYVIRAAAELLGRALRPQDEAFVVSFDTGARLVHARSKDVDAMRGAVLSLIPGGGTSIFDGVTFALQQLQGIPGKRALLVFSDGREGTSSASAKECGRLARALGVPVYLIVPPGGAKLDHALADVAEATGGLLLHATPVDKLGELADRLGEEVRSQYVLSFARPAGVKSGEWRSLRVDVRGREANVRAVQGYRAN